MARRLLQKFTAALICSGMFLFGLPVKVLATEISNITGNNGVYNIEASKVSGTTGFREYEKFTLDKGDIANLIYKMNNKEFSNFVNLVDNQVVINGIINTMRDNKFFDGHAIFVSPNGVVIGASGILNVGSLTLMAPSQNAYKVFKNNYSDNLEDFEFDLSKESYKSLIRNSSGTIEINGKIFARKGVNAYGRQIKIGSEDDSDTKPAIFAGWQDTDTEFTADTDSDAIFNELVSNNITNADSFNLKDGKIVLVTNKVNEEVISYSTFSEEDKKSGNDDTIKDIGGQITGSGSSDSSSSNSTKQKYETTTSIKVDTGLKTVEKKAVKDDSEKKDDDSWASKITGFIADQVKEKDSNESTERSIDYTYGKPKADDKDKDLADSVINLFKNDSNSENSKDSSGDSSDDKTTVSMDTAFKTIENSLSDDDSEIIINNAYIVANEIEIEANDASVKTVNASSIENFAKAVAEAVKTDSDDNTNTDNNDNTNNTNNTNNLLSSNNTTNLLSDNNSSDNSGNGESSGSSETSGNGETSSGGGTSDDSSKDTKDDDKDETTGYKIHENDYGTAPKASAKVEIKNSQISGEKVTIKANAKGTTETYIQLLTPIFEKWLNMLVSDKVPENISSILTKTIDKYADIEIDFDTDDDLDNDVGKAISEFFSTGVYTYHDGGRAEAEITIEDSVLKAIDTLTITSTAEANTNITTGKLDSHPVFLYGLGSTTSSNVKIANSTIKGGDDNTSVNINAYSKNNNSINYDSSNFLSVTKKEEESSGDKKDDSNSDDKKSGDSGSSDSGASSSDNNSGNNENKDNNSSSDNKNSSNSDSDKNNDSGSSDSSGSSNDNSGKKDDGSVNDGDGNSDSDKKDSDKKDDEKKDEEKKYESTTSLYNLTLLNNSIISDTNVEIEDSTIEANNVNIRAISNNKNNVSITNVSNVGKETDHSGVAIGMVINHTDTNANVNIKGSKISLPKDKADKVEKVTNDEGKEEDKTTTYGDARIVAQNINQYTHSVETKVAAAKNTFEVKPKELANYDPSYTIEIYEKLSEKFLDKLTDKMSEGLDKLDFELAGSAIWNAENNNASITLDSSDNSVTSIIAKNIDISSDILDFTLNTAKTNASADNKWGAGAAIIINDQNNTNMAKVTGKTELEAAKNLKVNATTQLPMNTLNLRIGLDTDGYKYVGGSFDQDEIGDFNPDFIYTDPSKFADLDVIKDLFGKIKSPRETAGSFEGKMDGLFNNLAQSVAKAETADVAGSVVVNTINNNTTALVDGGSNLKATGDGGNVVVNAVNSCVSYNGVGDVEFLVEGVNKIISKIKKDSKTEDQEEGADFGVGGTVLIDNYTNNATAKVDNAILTAENGTVNVLSANEESYMNLAVTGAEASKLAIQGTVNIQNIDGSTKAFIENGSKINAKTVNVKAGEALVKTKKTNKEYGKDPVEFNDNWEIKKNDERTAKDKLINIALIGTHAVQQTVTKEGEEGSDATASSGVSVGASVNVANISKAIESYIDNSDITASEDINVIADTTSWNINFIEAAASAGGVHVNKKAREEANKKAEENKDKTDEEKKTSEKENGQKTKNVGNWMDMLDEADDDAEDVMNLNDLFKENDASESAQKSVKENKDTINTADKNVDENGKETSSKKENADSSEKSNSDKLTNNENKKLEGDENKKADTTTAANNFSAAVAGAISVIKDSTKTVARITNSNTIKSGKDVNVKASKDTLSLDINGGLAKAGNVAAGAGVNVYRDLSNTQSYIDNSTITFTGAKDNSLNVTAENTAKILSLTAGAGAATNDQKNVKTAVGGSFSWNTLKNTISSKLNKVKVVKEDGAASPNINVLANDDSLVWNVTGGVAYANAQDKASNEGSSSGSSSSGGGSSTGVGVGIAATVDYSAKDVRAEINDSVLTDVNDVKVNANVEQDYNTIAVAGAVMAGVDSSYTFDGAVNTEVNVNKVVATAINSTIISDGDVEITANNNIENQSLAGALTFSTADKGLGVGIGAIVNVNNSDVTAEADGLTIKKSKSIKIDAGEIETLRFLAANLGLQFGGATPVNVNGIANVFVSDIVAHAINGSVLNSTRTVGIDSEYNNSTKGITVAGGGSMNGNAAGANLVANVYNNHVTSELEKGSKISTDGGVSISAKALEEVNMIPVGVALANEGFAVAANICANVVVDTVKALGYGTIEKSGSVLVSASDTTSLVSRGGTLALSNASSAVSGNVNVDVLDKTVSAEVKDTTVNSTGAVNVLATSNNYFVARKKNETTYDLASMDDAQKYTAKDSDGHYKERSATDEGELDDFINWNMSYDLSASATASVSGAVVVKVVDDEVNAYINNSTINAGELNVRANDYTIANAIIGRLSYGGDASVGANVFVLAGNSDVNSVITEGSKLNARKAIGIAADSTKKSTLITVGGGAAGTASINGTAVANVINDEVTAKINDNVIVSADSLNVSAQSDNDIKGLVVNASAAGTAAIGAVAYINKQNTKTTAQIGDEGTKAIINTKNNVEVQSKADDEFSALLVNVQGAGTAAVGGMGLLNFIDSKVNANIQNSTVTSEQGKVDVIADRGFNRSQAGKSNVFRNWFKDTSSMNDKENGKTKSLEKSDIDNLNKTENLAPIVGAVSVAGAGNAAVTGTVISNDMEGNIIAEVKNSTVSTEKGLNINANQTFVNYDAIASVAGAGEGAGVTAVGVINLLEDNITAQLIDSTVSKGGVTTDAASTMNLNQLVLSGAGAGVGAAVNLTVDYNEIQDKVHSYITNSIIYGDTNVNAEHGIEINNILLAGTVAGVGAGVTVIPVLNNYSGETFASINGNSKINDGSININANDSIDNFSAIAGVSVAGVGASVSGYAIRNNYTNKVSADIDNAEVSTTGDININSGSLIDATNALLSGGIAGVGAAVSANVIINDIESQVSSYINNTVVTNAGAITLTSNKDKEDSIENLAGSISVAGIGGAGAVNSIFNFYEGTTKSYVNNTEIKKASALALQSYGKRYLETTDIGGVGAGLGGAIGVNAIVNQINSEVLAYVDAKDKSVDITGDLSVSTDSQTRAKNKSGIVAIAGGVAAGANIGLHNYDDLSKAEILSGDKGQINAGTSNITSNSTYGLKNDTVSVSGGFSAVAGDVTIINMGKAGTAYSNSENGAKADEAINDVKDIYNDFSTDGKFKMSGSSEPKTGAIARSNANLTTTGDANITASSKLQGLDGGDLTLKNTTLQAGGNAVNVGVKIVKLANNVLAEIAGGKVKSTEGDINLKAESENKVNIENLQAQVGGLTISGAAGIYKNSALTQAIIDGSNVTAENVNIAAKSTNKSIIDDNAYVISLANAGFSISDNRDKNNTYAIITGKTDITADSLNMRATGNTELSSTHKTTTGSAYSLNYLENNTFADSITKAMIEDATGTINVNGLNIIADSSKMSSEAKTNLTSLSLAGLTIGDSGSNMNAEFSAGINSPNGLVINNTGDTKIVSGVDANDNSKAATITSKAELISKKIEAISIGISEANAKNNTKILSKLVANEHNAKNLYMSSYANTNAKSNVGTSGISLVGVNSQKVIANSTSNVGVEVNGKNTIEENVNIYTNHNATTDVDLAAATGGFVDVSVSNLDSIMSASTDVKLSGELNADNITVNSNTTRNSILDLSLSSKGVLSVGVSEATNNLGGNSTVELNGLTTDLSKKNTIDISNNSTNTQDVVSASSSGGLIAVGNNVRNLKFNTSTNTNVKNSDIKSSDTITLKSNSENIVKDDYVSSAGGVVVVVSNDISNSYTSNSKVSVEKSKLSAKDIFLKAVSDIRNGSGTGATYYRGSSKGFIAKNGLEVHNYINQNNEIEIIESELNAENNIDFSTWANSNFHTAMDSSGSGFVAIPKAYDYINTDFRNKVTVDEDSIITAVNKAIFNFDSDSKLSVYSHASTSHFAFKDPVAESYLTYAIRNELDNSGTIKAGNLVDINYMDSSSTTLSQYAYSECFAAVATTTENGSLTKTINNVLNVREGADITSNKDVDISYSRGRGNDSSTVRWHTISYGLFGIPIENYGGGPKSVRQYGVNSLQLDGTIAAGFGANKYIKINSDGTIDTASLQGMSSGNFSLSGNGTIDGTKLKESIIQDLNEKIAIIESNIQSYTDAINEETNQINELNGLISDNNDKLKEINGYTFKNKDDFDSMVTNDIKTEVKNGFIANGDVKTDDKGNQTITVDYESIINDYQAYVDSIKKKESELTEGDKYEFSMQSISEYIESQTTEKYTKLTADQKAVFTSGYDKVNKQLTSTKKGQYSVYQNQYILVSDIVKDEQTGVTTCKEINELNNSNAEFQAQVNSYSSNLTGLENIKTSLENEKTVLISDLAEAKAKDVSEYKEDYAIVFGDSKSEASGINISGITEGNITGNGNFKTSSAAFTVDNYSTRTVILNTIDFGSDKPSGLTIGGKNYGDYLNTDKKIGSSDGTHYISEGNGGNGDITINNYYDVTNPFASTLDIPNNTLVSDVIFQGTVSTKGGVKVFNDSGNINVLSNMDAGSMNLVAANGDVNINNSDVNYAFKENDSIFAGGNVNITAKNLENKGNITAGYKERKIIITDDMLSNLVLDPTTGETNLINLGDKYYLGDNNGNNVKAVYKDGQIYLFNINNNAAGTDRGKITIKSETNSLNDGTLTMYDGYQNIVIDNQTDKQLNVASIINSKSTGGLYLNNSQTQNAQNGTNAKTSITSKGKLVLNKLIKNSIAGDTADAAGVLTIASNNGIDTNAQILTGGKASINNTNGNVNILETITNLDGDITISNANGDLKIGSLDNDKNINAVVGDVIISQTNGNILNGITSQGGNTSSNDIGNSNPAYKTLIAAGNDIVINVIDGDIGVNSNPTAAAGLDSSTRNFTDSININAGNNVVATAKNSTKSDKRFINLRAKDSDLKVKNITADGDVVLTAADWKVADTNPTPDDDSYFEGYSILNVSDGSPINGQNVSLISSNTIGTKDKKMIVTQDTTLGGTRISMEAENDIYTDIKSNSDNPNYVDAIISKRGNVELTNSASSIINQITADGHLHILETGKELTIYNIGGGASGAADNFDDILFPHDNIKIGTTDTNAAIPDSIAIEVLDSNGGSSAGSALKIYSAYVKGRNNGQGEYDENGRQIADVSLMADNIYVNSANAKNSYMPTIKNANGYKHVDDDYTDADMGLLGDNVYLAQGINTYGDGKAIVLDVKGVSKEFVDENAANATRTNYIVQSPVTQDPAFVNLNNQISDHDYRADNVVISVNNNSSTDRGVIINSIYADDAYIDTKNSNLSVKDGYIQDYAEFSNVDKKITVDNDFRRRVTDADTQIYTAKTGSFALDLDREINMKTTAPVVGNDFDKLTNNYQSEGNFVNKSRKDSTNLNDNTNRYKAFEKQNYQEELKRTSMRFDTTKDADLRSNFKIYDLSTTGAMIKNTDNLKIGDSTNVRIAFDDLDVTIKSKVTSVQGDKVGVEFVDITPDVANRILYRYMQKQNTMKISKK